MSNSKSDQTVGDFVAAKASKNGRVQQLSTNGLQQVQYKSIKNNKIPQGSTGFCTWFGIWRLPGSSPGSSLDSTPKFFGLLNAVDLGGFDRHKIDYSARPERYFRFCKLLNLKHLSVAPAR